MKNHSIYPSELFWSAWGNRSLIWRMAKREVIGRYKGSILGLAWSFFNPIFMLVIYTFVFSVVFKARWGVLWANLGPLLSDKWQFSTISVFTHPKQTFT